MKIKMPVKIGHWAEEREKIFNVEFDLDIEELTKEFVKNVIESIAKLEADGTIDAIKKKYENEEKED